MVVNEWEWKCNNIGYKVVINQIKHTDFWCNFMDMNMKLDAIILMLKCKKINIEKKIRR